MNRTTKYELMARTNEFSEAIYPTGIHVYLPGLSAIEAELQSSILEIIFKELGSVLGGAADFYSNYKNQFHLVRGDNSLEIFFRDGSIAHLEQRI